MPAMIYNGSVLNGTVLGNASDSKYINSENKLTSSNVQDAIDELAIGIDYTGKETEYIYVSATNGNDETGDGTEAKPYASITKAINIIPRVYHFGKSDSISKANTNIYDIIVEGGTYNECIHVSNGQYVNLRLSGDVTVNAYSAYIIESLENGFLTITSLDQNNRCSLTVNAITDSEGNYVTRSGVVAGRCALVDLYNLSSVNFNGNYQNAQLFASRKGTVILRGGGTLNINGQAAYVLHADYSSEIIMQADTITYGEDYATEMTFAYSSSCSRIYMSSSGTINSSEYGFWAEHFSEIGYSAEKIVNNAPTPTNVTTCSEIRSV